MVSKHGWDEACAGRVVKAASEAEVGRVTWRLDGTTQRVSAARARTGRQLCHQLQRQREALQRSLQRRGEQRRRASVSARRATHAASQRACKAARSPRRARACGMLAASVDSTPPIAAACVQRRCAAAERATGAGHFTPPSKVCASGRRRGLDPWRSWHARCCAPPRPAAAHAFRRGASLVPPLRSRRRNAAPLRCCRALLTSWRHHSRLRYCLSRSRRPRPPSDRHPAPSASRPPPLYRRSLRARATRSSTSASWCRPLCSRDPGTHCIALETLHCA